MHMNRAFRESSRVGNFRNVQVFYKSKKENSALPIRKGPRGYPNGLNLLINRRPLFGRNASIGPIVYLVALNAFGLSPKLNTAAPHMIANEIDCDTNEPCVDAAIPAKCLSALVGIQEAILG